MAALDSDVASAQRSEVEGGMDIQDMVGCVLLPALPYTHCCRNTTLYYISNPLLKIIDL